MASKAPPRGERRGMREISVDRGGQPERTGVERGGGGCFPVVLRRAEKWPLIYVDR